MLGIKRLWNLTNRLSVGQKVMTVILFEVLSYSMVTTIAISQIHSVGTEVRHMADLYLPLFSSTESIRQSIQEDRLNLKEIIFVGGRVVYDKDAEETYLGARARYEQGNKAIFEQIGWSENLIRVATSKETDEEPIIVKYSEPLLLQLSKIRQANRVLTKRVENIFEHVEDGSFLMGMEMLGEVAASEAALTQELDRLVAMLEEVKRTSVAYATRVEDNASRYTMLASIIMVSLVIAVVFWVIRRNISRPLHMMTHVISSFDAAKEEEETPYERRLLERGDELGMVSKSFSTLKRDLRARGRDLEAAKEEAERANRAKSLFLASASHDLRQPMHAMRMYIAALRHKVRNKEALSIIGDIEAVSVSTARLLHALLDISRLEAGAVKPHFETFAVQEIFRRVGRSFRPEAYRKNISLRFVPTDAYVRSDPDLLEQIVSNLTSNAIRYTPVGKVLIGCRHRGDRISIEVWDTGCGVPDEHREAIFDDFHQLRNHERDRSKGLGLGLSIVRRLALCLNHEIEHGSTVGRGSRFAVLVQRSQPQPVERVEPTPIKEHSSDLAGIKVLVIENDLDVLNATSRLLRFWGCRVTSTLRFDDAMNRLKEGLSPDAVLADYRLPGPINGVQAIAEVRAKTGDDLPAVVVTGDIDGIDLTALEEQDIKVLYKPLRPAKLRTLLYQMVVLREELHKQSEVA